MNAVIPNRPDFSEYLAHFTKDGEPHGILDPHDPMEAVSKLSASERLVEILKTGKICSSKMPWTGRRAVAFTECPWSSLLDHANRYSSFAVGFSKPRVFAAGGGPVYYVRADHYKKQQWVDDLHTFVTPFWPEYRPGKLKEPGYLKSTVDYSHEREWRVPHDFSFKLEQVEFVIPPTYKDMARFPDDLKNAIGREKFLLMEVYRTVERLWPVHNIA
jgi:hypothetical protein